MAQNGDGGRGTIPTTSVDCDFGADLSSGPNRMSERDSTGELNLAIGSQSDRPTDRAIDQPEIADVVAGLAGIVEWLTGLL